MKEEHEVEALLDALEAYGQHQEGCPLHWDSNADPTDPEACECGLNEILVEHGREGLP